MRNVFIIHVHASNISNLYEGILDVKGKDLNRVNRQHMLKPTINSIMYKNTPIQDRREK